MTDAVVKDGDYFLQQLQEASKRLADLCAEFDPDTLQGLPEEGC